MKVRIAIVTPPRGRLIQKHHRQVTSLVKTPPSSGPTTEEIPKTAPKAPCTAGRFRSGKVLRRIVTAPLTIPELPSPATARPIMKATEFGAAAQMMDPISKMPMRMRNTHFGE